MKNWRSINGDKMTIEGKLKEIISNELGVDPSEIVPEARLTYDLGADFLSAVELVIAIEEEFGIEIPDEEAEKLLTVGDVVKYLKEKIGKE